MTQYESYESACREVGAKWMCKTCDKLQSELISRIAKIEVSVSAIGDRLGDHEKRLEAVETCLKEMKQHNDGGNVTNQEVTRAKSRSVVAKSVEEQLDQRCRIVVRDLPKSKDESPVAQRDSDIGRTAQALQIEEDDTLSAFRAGKIKEDAIRPRILVVRLRIVEMRNEILNQGKFQQGLRVGLDLSKEEREADEEFFKKIVKHKERSNPDQVFRVKGPPGRRWLTDQSGKRVKLPSLD